MQHQDSRAEEAVCQTLSSNRRKLNLRILVANAYSHRQCPPVADESRDVMRTASMMDDCNASALIPAGKSSNGVLLSRLSPYPNCSDGRLATGFELCLTPTMLLPVPAGDASVCRTGEDWRSSIAHSGRALPADERFSGRGACAIIATTHHEAGRARSRGPRGPAFVPPRSTFAEPVGSISFQRAVHGDRAKCPCTNCPELTSIAPSRCDRNLTVGRAVVSEYSSLKGGRIADSAL